MGSLHFPSAAYNGHTCLHFCRKVLLCRRSLLYFSLSCSLHTFLRSVTLAVTLLLFSLFPTHSLFLTFSLPQSLSLSLTSSLSSSLSLFFLTLFLTLSLSLFLSSSLSWAPVHLIKGDIYSLIFFQSPHLFVA